MALEYGNPKSASAGKTPATAVKTQSMGFDLLSRMQVNQRANEGGVEKFLENAAQFLENANVEGVSILDFSKNVYQFLAYSNAALVKEVNGKALYFVIQFATTGPSHQTPAAIMEQVKFDMNRRQAPAPLVMPGNAIEGNLASEIEATIEHGMGINEFVMCGGIVIHATQDITDPSVAGQAIAEAVNTLNNTAVVSTGEYTELSLKEAVTKPAIRELSYSSLSENLNLLGDLRFTNFRTTLKLRQPDSAVEINAGGGEFTLSETAGNVQVIVYEKPVSLNTPQGVVQSSVYTFFPTVTLNCVDLAVPTTGSMLIALAQTAIITQDQRWVTVLAETVDAGKNPGVIGLLKNELVEGKAEMVDLTSKAFTIEQREQYIKTAIENNPVMQVDTPMFGAGTAAMNLFVVAADETHPDSLSAREEILDVCDDLTGGAFKEFSPSDIFIGCKRIPYGTFLDKDKTNKPLDMIDMIYLLDKKSGASVDMIKAYIASEAPGGSDLTRIKMFSELRNNVAITGYKERMLINPAFISTLLAGLASQGMTFSAEPSRVLETNQYNFGLTQSIYDAGIGATAAFHSYGNKQQNTGAFFQAPVFRR